MKPTPESITIKRLGPIAEARIDPGPLTILIGEQASGKSLIAQVVFFFRAIKSLSARYYTPELISKPKWQESLVKSILDDLRGVPFGYFADGSANLKYKAGKIEWTVNVYKSNRMVSLNQQFKLYLEELAESWKKKKGDLGSQWSLEHLFIPTERSVFTRLAGKAPTVLYAEHQPLTLRLFAEYLEIAKDIYSKLAAMMGKPKLENLLGADWSKTVEFVLNQQEKAIQGEAYVPAHGAKLWKWKIRGEQNKKLIIPLEATSSGQMEAWPFFVISATMGSLIRNMAVYFEEPETHLHPQAQVEVMKTIAFLTGRDHHFMITTHSPFLLYATNNMIQRYYARQKKGFDHQPDNNHEIMLDPSMVRAYRIKGSSKNLLEPGGLNLIDLSEIEKVADELGGEFDNLMDEMETST